MNSKLSWMVFLVMQYVSVTSRPVQDHHVAIPDGTGQDLPYIPYTSNSQKEQVISVRITSSVAVGRGNGKKAHKIPENNLPSTELITSTTALYVTDETTIEPMTEVPSNLVGANMEFIKQLNAKKEANDLHLEQHHPFRVTVKNQQYNESDDYLEDSLTEIEEYDDNVPLARKVSDLSPDTNKLKENKSMVSPNLNGTLHPFEAQDLNSNGTNITSVSTKESDNNHDAVDEMSLPSISQLNENEGVIKKTDQDNIFQLIMKQNDSNYTDDSIAESSIKSVFEIANKNVEKIEDIENVPITRSMLLSPSQNYFHGLQNKPLNERNSSPRLTTVSFNIVHDTSKIPPNFNEPSSSFINPTQTVIGQQKFYEPPKIYSQPAQIYSEPAKFYSQPAKIYSEPAKIYSEPAKVYSEPAKIYSEPAKFYSEPASLHLAPNDPVNYSPWQQHSLSPTSTTFVNTTPFTAITNPSDLINTQRIPEHRVEKNYEVDEKVSVLTDGRSHGVQESSTEKCKQDNCKIGYVVEGRQYKKYRVEERTSDGFIVGEYGVVRNEDGALRGVRYTADSDASPRLIYDALMKFLQLK